MFQKSTSALLLLVCMFSFPSCTKYYYGSAANKAFCRPSEREYMRYERMVKRNGGNNPDHPYILKGRLIDQDSNELMFGTLHEKGGNYGYHSNYEGTFQISIADSQFVKKKYTLEVNYLDYKPAEFIFLKKDFEDNYLDTTLILIAEPILLD